MNPDEYVAEPYVTPGNIDGPTSPNYGMGGWTWYTGSASWFQKVIVDWILGVRAAKDGLIIDPCIPGDWKEYSVKRLFRGTVYNIKVYQDSKQSEGKKQVFINGVLTDKNVINIKDKNNVLIEVYFGKH